jgi:hypothetical protein
MGSVIELTPRRLAKKPQSWSVEIEHTEHGALCLAKDRFLVKVFRLR